MLLEAGIEAPAPSRPCRSGDNSNILAARVARETFGVDNVVARIYDPRRPRSTSGSASRPSPLCAGPRDQMLRRLLPAGSEPQWRDPSGRSAGRGARPPGLGGPGGLDVERRPAPGSRSCSGSARLLPAPHPVFQDGDLLRLVMPDERDEVDDIAAERPEEE